MPSAVPALAVDTHVSRVSQRLGSTRATDADEIHDQLCALIPRARWTRATHLLIIHGRRTCHARAPGVPALRGAGALPVARQDRAGGEPAHPEATPTGENCTDGVCMITRCGSSP